MLNNSLEKRVEDCSKLIRKYPEKIPVIVQSDKIKIRREKYLVDKSMSFTQFALILRKNIEEMMPEEAIYYFSEDSSIIVPSVVMNQLYLQHKNKQDGFLYVFLMKENTFG